MRILFVVHQFMPEYASGTERFTLNIAKTHQRNGHAVSVLTCSIGDASFWPGEMYGLLYAVVDGIPVHAVKRSALGPLADVGGGDFSGEATTIRDFLQQGAYDVVHVTHTMRMLPIVEMVRDLPIPYMLTLTDFFSICYRVNLKRADHAICNGPADGTECRKFCLGPVTTAGMLAERQRRFRSILASATELIACSEFVAKIFEQEFPELAIRVLNHGIDLLRFAPPAAKGDRAPIVFGFIGTLSETKGVHILTEAFVRASPANARLELVGPCFDKDFLQRLRALEHEAISIKESVDHAEIPTLLAGFDILCLPSLVPEAGSLALREGFGAGLPALVSDIGWPAEVVLDKGCGRTAAAGDVEAWSQAIDQIVQERACLKAWTAQVPPQMRIEEESFFYDQLYRRAINT